MKFDIITIFPNIFDSYLKESILGRAQKQGLIEIKTHDLRDYTTDKHHSTDDAPYGGGVGMVMLVEPIYRALRSLPLFEGEVGGGVADKRQAALNDNTTPNPSSKRRGTRVILLSPRGQKFTQRQAKELTQYNQIILIAGRYEGVDERVTEFVDETISIGDYVLNGGELGAMVIVEAVSRLLPGVLGKDESSIDESFNDDNSAEYPHYTRPEIFIAEDGRELKVPEVLLSGHHAEIKKWRKNKRMKKYRVKILVVLFLLSMGVLPVVSAAAPTTVDSKKAAYISSLKELSKLQPWQIWKDPNSSRLYRVLAKTVREAQIIKNTLQPATISPSDATHIKSPQELHTLQPWQVWKDEATNRLYKLAANTARAAQTIRARLNQTAQPVTKVSPATPPPTINNKTNITLPTPVPPPASSGSSGNAISPRSSTPTPQPNPAPQPTATTPPPATPPASNTAPTTTATSTAPALLASSFKVNLPASINGTTDRVVTLSGSISNLATNTFIAKYEWDYTSDGIYDYSSTAQGTVDHLYPAAGAYTATFRATDNLGNKAATATQVIIIAPTPTPAPAPVPTPAPIITITAPPSGASWETGSTHTVSWTISSTLPSNQSLAVILQKNNQQVNGLNTVINGTATGYTWNIPSDLAVGTDYKIEVFSYNQATGISLAAGFSGQFSIVAPAAAPKPVSPAPDNSRGDIIFTFESCSGLSSASCSPWSDNEKTALTNFLYGANKTAPDNTLTGAYQWLRSIIGLPYQSNRSIRLKHDPTSPYNAYYSGDQIVFKGLDISGITVGDPQKAVLKTFGHELVHAFHGNALMVSGFEEGTARMLEELVASKILGQTSADFFFLYHDQNNDFAMAAQDGNIFQGIEPLTGNTYSLFGSTFLKLYYEDSTFWQRFHDKLYEQYNLDAASIRSAANLTAWLSNLAPSQVEGKPLAGWLGSEAAFSFNPPAGPALVANLDKNGFLYVYYIYRQTTGAVSQQVLDNNGQLGPLNPADVAVTVKYINAQGQIIKNDAELGSSGWGGFTTPYRQWISLAPLELGTKVRADIELKVMATGLTLTKSVWLPSVLGQFNGINGVVSTNANTAETGTVVITNTTMPAREYTLTVANGAFFAPNPYSGAGAAAVNELESLEGPLLVTHRDGNGNQIRQRRVNKSPGPMTILLDK